MKQNEQVLNKKQNQWQFIGDRPAADYMNTGTSYNAAGKFINTNRFTKSAIHQWIAGLARPVRFLRKVDFSNNRIYSCDPSLRVIHDYHFYGYIPLDRK